MSSTMNTIDLNPEDERKDVVSVEGEEVTSVDLEDPTVEESEDSDPKDVQKRRKVIGIVAVMSLALLALIVGLSVGLTNSDKSSSTGNESTTKTSSERSENGESASSTTLSTSPADDTTTTGFVPFGSHTFLELFHSLEALQGSDYMIANFQDPQTPQHIALTWMADEDEISPQLLDDGETFPDSPLLRERYAASVSFFALGGDNQTNDQDSMLSILDTDKSICLWKNPCTSKLDCGNEDYPFGFSCQSEETNFTRVTHIDFSEYELVGQLPIEIKFFDQAEAIKLSGNAISGPIPSEFGLMSNLQVLELNYNDLTGPIPSELGNLVQLKALELDNNALSGPIPSELGLLSNLTELELEYNDLTGPIPSELGNLVQLNYLYLYENHGLNGTLPQTFEKLTNMYTLYLDGTSLTDGIEQAICSNLAAFPSLNSIWADCLETPEEPREVNCTCCTTCCDKSGCEDDESSDR